MISGVVYLLRIFKMFHRFMNNPVYSQVVFHLLYLSLWLLSMILEKTVLPHIIRKIPYILWVPKFRYWPRIFSHWSTPFARRYHSVPFRLRLGLQVALSFRCSHKKLHAIPPTDTYNTLHLSYRPWCGHSDNILRWVEIMIFRPRRCKCIPPHPVLKHPHMHSPLV